MGVYGGPNVSSDGLILALDAGNIKSLNIPTQADHGYADWYCLVSGTVTYSIVNLTGGVIYEKNGSTITAVVAASGPQRGTFSITAGRFYYGSVPINLVVEDGHQCLVPLTMMGTQFWNIAVREAPSTYYVYSPYQAATVNFYDNTANGIASTPTSTLSLSAGQSGTFTSNNLTNHWISSNTPILATVTQINGADKTILSPMSTYVYQRFQSYLRTTNNTTPTNNNAYVTYDSTYKVMNMSIADGSGYDCAQGLGLEYLSDTYSWGNVLSDYTIVFPYTATVTTSYWSGSAWVVWDTHSNIAGSITNPPRITRDGTNGPGVEASTLSGAATNMASGATLWKWEGTAPFYLAINDNADDEFSVLGWLSSRNTSPRSSNVIIDRSGGGNNGTLVNGVTFSLLGGGAFQFDGISQYVDLNKSFISGNEIQTTTSSYTLEAWINVRSSSGTDGSAASIIGNAGNYGVGMQVGVSNGKPRINYGFRFTNNFYGSEFFYNTWTHICLSRINGQSVKAYLNGNLDVSFSSTELSVPSGQTYENMRIGNGAARVTGFYDGYISGVRIYNRGLTDNEIQQNYIATKSRYGL